MGNRQLALCIYILRWSIVKVKIDRHSIVKKNRKLSHMSAAFRYMSASTLPFLGN